MADKKEADAPAKKESAAPAKKTVVTGAKYVGDGAYLVGIPARNLTADEWRIHRKEITANAKAEGRDLYTPIEKEVEEGEE